MTPSNSKLLIDDEKWALAVRKEQVLRRLYAKRLKPDDMREGCRELSLSRAQLFRLLRRFKADPRASTLVPRKPGPVKGILMLEDAVETIIGNAIQSYYLNKQKPKISQLLRIIGSECHKAGVSCPSRKAVSQRVQAIHRRELLVAREGVKAANDATRPVVGALQALRPLQIVQVDHTKVDVFVVDEKHRQPIGRPWLTLLVDICTRMVTGYHLSLEAPSSVSVALALQQAVLPKDEWLAARGISAPWPVRGVPEVLHMDNGKEFHAKALKRGAEEYGIRLMYRPVATPHYGGHIERLIGTMMGEVHLLPGTTFSNIDERGAYESERHAAVTLKELDQWLAIQIVGRYHHDIHRSLARPPVAVWEEFAAHPEVSFREPSDKESFYYDFLPFEERKISREGINLFGIKYWDSVLTLWAGVRKEPMIVRYDPRDLSMVFVQTPNGDHLPVRYRDLARPPITLWEHKRARQKLQEQGRRDVNEQMLFDAIEAQRMLVEESALKTKSARRDQQRTAEALQPMLGRRELKVIETFPAEEEDSRPAQPFEIEEWS
jgi:putative transposase